MTGTTSPFPDLSRRRFGTLLLGGTGWLLTPDGAQALSSGLLPSGVGPVGKSVYRDDLPRSTPEAQGVSSGAILAFLDDVERAGLELHSMMLMRHGHVVAEGWWWPFRNDRIHITHSLTKSITAAAVGLAIDEGRFGLTDKVVSFFPDFVPADANANMRAMTVGDLLTMRTGHDKETSGSVWRPIKTSWIAEFFKIPVVHQPGTKFVYTSAASYMLSAIVSRTTNQAMADYLKPRLFDPLGIDHWTWDTSPGGITPGGNGLSWNTAASLKFGALHAGLGQWQGKRILSESWVRAATATHIADADGGDGYGYQWWTGPSGAYFALGLFSQLAIVFPEQNATLAIFAAIKSSGSLKSLIWKHFPRAFGASAIPVGRDVRQLAQRCAQLRLLPPLFAAEPPSFAGGHYTVAPNDQGVRWIAFDPAGQTCTFRMADAGGEHSITAGFAEYLEQDTSMTGNRLHHEYRPPHMRVVAGARWTAPGRLEMTWQFVESAFRDTVVCTFSGNSVTVDRSVNLNSAETRLPTLVGTPTQ